MLTANVQKLGALAAVGCLACTWAAPIHAGSLWTSRPSLAQAGESVYLNDQCQRVSEDLGAARVNEYRAFKAGGESYWLVLAGYQDGASLLCVTRSGFAQGEPLAVPKLQRQFINSISQEGASSTFLIDHRNGNGFSVMITRYRLNLANPRSPKLTELKKWSQRLQPQ